MKKKIFITIFMILLLIPFVGMSIYKADLSIEKKYNESFPSFIEKGKVNVSFFQQMTDYVADRFAFRQEMITADAEIKAGVFKSSSNDKVVVGNDGWLFFRDTLNDYQRKDVMNERELHNCAKVLRLIQDGTRKAGAQFAFAVAPNKNSLYGEYMPDRFVILSDKGNLDGLRKEMREQKVNYIDLMTPLKKAKKQNKQVYHKLDTHWNNLGASIGCENIMDNLKRDHVDYSDKTYANKKNFSGDLQGMLFPKSTKKDWNMKYETKNTYHYVNRVESTEQIEIKTDNDKGNGKNILMYRDSFGNALVPFMAQEYQKGYFTKEVPYDISLVDSEKADDVVIELAQRQIPTLLEGVPYMMAPGISFDEDVKDTSKTNATMTVDEVEEADNVISIYGEADKRWTDDDSEIYISLYGKKNLLMYEAFPSVYDPTDAEADRAYSYGAYIDTSSVPKDNYQIEIITKKAGSYYTTGFLNKYVVK